MYNNCPQRRAEREKTLITQSVDVTDERVLSHLSYLMLYIGKLTYSEQYDWFVIGLL